MMKNTGTKLTNTVTKMKFPKIGDFVLTDDGIGSGIITWVGIVGVEINNNVNINHYKFDEIEVI